MLHWIVALPPDEILEGLTEKLFITGLLQGPEETLTVTLFDSLPQELWATNV
jgi:hypothetical protein